MSKQELLANLAVECASWNDALVYVSTPSDLNAWTFINSGKFFIRIFGEIDGVISEEEFVKERESMFKKDNLMSEQKQTTIEITDKSVKVNAYGNVTEKQIMLIEGLIDLAIESDKRFILRVHGCDRTISGNLFTDLDEEIKLYHKNHYARYSPKTGVLFKVDKIKTAKEDAHND